MASANAIRREKRAWTKDQHKLATEPYIHSHRKRDRLFTHQKSVAAADDETHTNQGGNGKKIRAGTEKIRAGSTDSVTALTKKKFLTSVISHSREEKLSFSQP